MRAAAVGALGLLLLLPWAPVLLSSYGPTPAVFGDAPVIALVIGSVLILGLLIARLEPWLAAGLLMVVISVVLHGDAVLAAPTVVYFGLGIGLLVLLSHGLPAGTATLIRWGLLVSVSLEIAYRIAQHWQVDPLWYGWAPDPRAAWTGGSFLTPRYLGAMAAMVAPLAPGWLLPWLALGVGLSWSYLAMAALLVGLLVRWPAHRLCLVTVGALGAWLVLQHRLFVTATVAARLDLWRLGGADLLAWPAWLVGHGPGSWASRMALAACPCPPAEVFVQAHNEIVQWVYETGAVGAALLAGWGWSLWPRLRAMPPMWQGAFVALAVLSLGLHVFHLAALAAVAVLVLSGGFLSRRTVMEAR